MTKKIKQVGEWKVIFDDFHKISSIINENSGYQSLWKEGQETIDRISKIEEMDDIQFLDYCELIQQNLSAVGMDN